NYLFHGQRHDLGDGTLGCGRRSDAIKFFICWKYYGKTGYQRKIEKSQSNVRRFVELLHQGDMQSHRMQMLLLGSDDHQPEEHIAKAKIQLQQQSQTTQATAILAGTRHNQVCCKSVSGFALGGLARLIGARLKDSGNGLWIR
ncbi:hypothetical protein BGZ83_003914, partial [Gryganskiella cystojenkinii]